VAERAEFLANARALLMPTIYCEPGGNVAIEAMMCGTPVICPDFGVMSETVKPGVSGFHFRILREAVEAVQTIGLLDPGRIRSYALQNFSLRATKPKFEEWFMKLQSLWGDGWYQGAIDKSELKV
jgi:glycosyltransferase involved in cell wall biosynthesis